MKITAYLVSGFSFPLTNVIICTPIIFVLVLWLFLKWKNRHFEKLTSQIKGPKAYPIIGMAHEFLGGTNADMMEIILNYCKIYMPEPLQVWIGPFLFVGIMKPEDIQIVLNNSAALEKDSAYHYVKYVLGDGLVTAPVDKWRVHRRLIDPAFNTNQLKQFLSVFNKKSQILIRNLEKEVGKTQQFDLWKYVSSATLDMICQTSMGYDCGTESNSDYKLFSDSLTKGLHMYSERMYKPWFYSDFLFSIYLKFIGEQDILERIKKLPNQVLKERKEIFKKKNLANTENVDKNEENHKCFKNLIDVLLNASDVNETLSDSQIRDEVVTMMAAGSDTTAVADCYCLLLLAMNMDIQDKVYNEIYEVLGDSDQPISFEDANQLVYLEQVIKETLRLFPIVPFFVRRLEEDIKISKYTLPKGLRCVVSPISTHHMPELYPNPWEFNPENFSPENIAKRHRYSFIPFSGGPRGCIGSKYAMLSMKVIIATFLQNYCVHTDVKISDIKFEIDILMRSVNGYKISIQPRNRAPNYES